MKLTADAEKCCAVFDRVVGNLRRKGSNTSQGSTKRRPAKAKA